MKTNLSVQFDSIDELHKVLDANGLLERYKNFVKDLIYMSEPPYKSEASRTLSVEQLRYVRGLLIQVAERHEITLPSVNVW